MRLAALLFCPALAFAQFTVPFARTSTTAAAPPVLSVSPTTLSFNGTAGGANPATQTVSISNTGSGTLNWSTSSDQTWLTVAPTSGTGAATLTVTATITGLAANTYTGHITITATGATGSPATVTVSLNVAAGTGPWTFVSSCQGSSGDTGGNTNPPNLTLNCTGVNTFIVGVYTYYYPAGGATSLTCTVDGVAMTQSPIYSDTGGAGAANGDSASIFLLARTGTSSDTIACTGNTNMYGTSFSVEGFNDTAGTPGFDHNVVATTCFSCTSGTYTPAVANELLVAIANVVGTSTAANTVASTGFSFPQYLNPTSGGNEGGALGYSALSGTPSATYTFTAGAGVTGTSHFVNLIGINPAVAAGTSWVSPPKCHGSNQSNTGSVSVGPLVCTGATNYYLGLSWVLGTTPTCTFNGTSFTANYNGQVFGPQAIAIYYVDAITGGSSVTFQCTGPTGMYMAVQGWQFGAHPSLDAQPDAGPTSCYPCDTATITPAASNDLVLLIADTNYGSGASTIASSGVTFLDPLNAAGGADGGAFGYQILSGGAGVNLSYHVTGTITGASGGGAVMFVSLKHQ